jgi:hypothetical protein
MTRQEPTSVHDVVNDHEHQRREWRFERVGWAFMALLLLAALAGTLGPGPLSKSSAGSPESGLRVEYERFGRHAARARLRIRIDADDDTIRIWLGRDFIDRVEIQHVDPEPVEVEAASDRQIFSFARTSGGGALQVNVHFEPRRIGPASLQLGLEDERETALQLRMFVYP